MKALVVGARGFIGRSLKQSLERSGHEAYAAEPQELANWSLPVDTIFHLAQKILPYTDESPTAKQAIEKNQESLIEAINLTKKLKAHLIFASSSSVYGNSLESKPTPESQPLNPINPNGHSKLLSEKLIQEYVDNTLYTIVRLFNVFGPGQKKEFLISALLSHFTNSTPLKIRFPDAVRDYIDVDDVCSALIKLMTLKKSGVYNLGSGRETSVLHVLTQLEDLTGKKAHLEPLTEVEHKSVKMEVPYMVADVTKLQKAIDWSPQISLEQGLKKLISKPL